MKIWIADEVLIDYDGDNENKLVANILLSATDDVYDSMLKLADFYKSTGIKDFNKLLFDNDGTTNIYVDITEDLQIKRVDIDVDYRIPNYHNPNGTICENYYQNIIDKIAEEDLNKLQKVVISEAEKYLKHSLQEEFKAMREEYKHQ